MSDDVHRFFLGGYIDDEVAGELIMQMLNADSFDPAADWELIICSEGGDVEAGSAVFEQIRNFSQRGSGTHFVTTVATGKCESMATLIAQAGDYRVTGPLTIWTFHRARSNPCSGVTVADIRAEAEWVEQLEKDQDELMLERTTLSTKDYYKHVVGGSEWRLRGEALLDYGFVDEVR